MSERPYTFIDLFAGCGGLSEGFYQEDYKALLHLEIDAAACRTLQTRMQYYGYSQEEAAAAVLCEDITGEDIISLMERRITAGVDIIVGGPPCQAFSSVGRAQDPDSMQNDPRNYLFENYLRILNYYKPSLFVFENVKGILSAKPKGVPIFEKIIREMRKTYKVSDVPDTILLNAVHFGAPQNRERVILIGVRKDIALEPEQIYSYLEKTHYGYGEEAVQGLKKYVSVREAIGDLPPLHPGEGKEIIDFKPERTNQYLEQLRKPSFDKLYHHTARRHNPADRERYRILSENCWQLKDLQQIRPDLVHHDPKHFGNRYTVQEYDKPGRTVVAHLYKDGNLFIHPDPAQARTFTVREAARIQTFPDDFFLEGSRTEQYKQVGNAVPPMMARAIAKAMKRALKEIDGLRLGRER